MQAGRRPPGKPDGNQANPSGGPGPAGAPDGAQPAAGDDVATLRERCVAELKAISARVQQLSGQASADWVRAVQDAQGAVAMRQQAMMGEYFGRVQQAAAGAAAGPDLAELARHCNEQLDAARGEACKLVDESRETLRAQLDEGIAEANRDWDAGCARFVAALRDRLGRLDPAALDPAEVAAVGQALGWIASQMRKPVAG